METGKLTIFTSYTPGAGKSYYMLSEALEKREQGMSVVIGFLNGSHRDIGDLCSAHGLRRSIGKKYSLSKIIEYHPELVVLDEMGMGGANIDGKTLVYDDIDKLLETGINVYTTANLKRFESVNPKFYEVTGIRIKKTIPDYFLDKATSIVFIDRKPELMEADFKQKMLFSDKYKKSKIMQKNFKLETLEEYRRVSLDYLEKYSDKVKIENRREN